jgi:tetratricopeptide (TPR) repeat protein
MQIEELTDQMEKALLAEQEAEAASASASSQSNDAQDATRPQLPPGLAIQAGKSVDEVWADLNKSPLFMTEMEEDNEDIAALQALNYEGTPLENGLDFKERGNECFKVRGYADAREFYTKGIQILAAEERKRSKGEVTRSPEGVEDSADEVAEQRKVLEAMYVNRAACHLELRNYRSCWLDCGGALRLNPTNVKACYRSARALLAVDRIAEADDVCARGLALDADNAALRAVAADIVKRASVLDEKKRRDDERQARDRRRRALLSAALKARGIPTRATDKPPEMEDAALALVPDPDDPRSELAFPTVLLYPAHLESDFIKAFQETQALADHLSYVFPLPWDRDGAYSLTGVEAYVETVEGGLLKMGKKVPLLKVLATGRVPVVDEVLKIFILPKAEADAWIKKYKEQKAAAKGG